MTIQSFSRYFAMVPAVLCIACLMAVAGTPPKKPGSKADIPPAKVADRTALQFADIAKTSGLRFVHNNGAFGQKYLPEALGPGCAFIDYDNDGYPDILFVDGQDWPGHHQAASSLKLFH